MEKKELGLQEGLHGVANLWKFNGGQSVDLLGGHGLVRLQGLLLPVDLFEIAARDADAGGQSLYEAGRLDGADAGLIPLSGEVGGGLVLGA